MRLSIVALILSLMVPVNSLQASTIEQNCLALNIFHEANGSSKLDMRAVGHVTLNRVKSGKFRSTICGVVYQDKQFSWTTHKGKPSTGFSQSQKVASNILSGNDKDVTSGATYFYNYKRTKPPWSFGMSETLRTDFHSYRKPV